MDRTSRPHETPLLHNPSPPWPSRRGLLVGAGIVALVVTLASFGAASADDEGTAPTAAQAALGERLFDELNFTNPATDYGTSCGGCHVDGGGIADRTPRSFADYEPSSLTAHKQVTLRNTPTLLDVDEMTALGWAGASTDLEELIAAKLTRDLYGWAPADRDRAVAAIQFTLLEEGTGGGPGQSYLDAFREAYDVDLEEVDAESALDWGARALADYVRTLVSTNTAPWDAFISINRFHPGPNPEEKPEHYAGGLWSRIGNQEGRGLVKRPFGFSQAAYRGFKTFVRIAPETDDEGNALPVGQCVICHVPPNFTDFAFHNSGIAELSYEAVHGEGSAADYSAPEAPSEATRSVPDPDDPSHIDLGRFNNAPEEEGAVGAFKTPTLRNLGGTDPYLHDGSAASLEEAVRAKVEVSRRAKAGELPNVDPVFARMQITEDDIADLVAFLRQLDEVGKEGFRQYLIKLADD